MTAQQAAERLYARRSGSGWLARCPAHEDREPSLSISQGRDGRTLIFCFAGCETADVLAAAGLSWRDVLPPRAPISPADRERQRRTRERAERAAWGVSDRVHELRRFYHSAMLRADRVCWKIGTRIRHARNEVERESLWGLLARLAPARSFFLAAWNFLCAATPDAMARFALASPAERRRMIAEGEST